MRQIETFDIDIVDNQDNTRVLQLEDVAVDSVKLIYNGHEDRFGILTSSELHFSMLVEDSEDGKFFHLFTGSETRYRVVLYDTTNIDEKVIIWVGCLLAEQFEEPFTGGNFFVNFVASDGIGRLKNYDFEFTSDSGRASIIEVIQRSISYTSIVLDIHFAKAIENTFFDLDYMDLEVDVSVYTNDNMSCYDVLEKLLESLGCRIFQYKNAWWVLGLSWFSEKVISYRVYPSILPANPNEIQRCELAREELTIPFEQTPELSVLPPIKNIEATWDDKQEEYLLPEDVVTHLPKYYREDIYDTTPQYWQLMTSGKIVAFNVAVIHDFHITNQEILSYTDSFLQVDFEQTINKRLFYLNSKLDHSFTDFDQISGVLPSEIGSNYIQIDEPLFIDLNEGELLSFALECRVPKRHSATDQQLNNAIEDGSLLGSVLYAITFQQFKKSGNAQYVLYNFSGDTDFDQTFGFDFTYSEGQVKCKLAVNDFYLKKKGYYNLRLYPVIQNPLLGPTIIFEKCHLKLQSRTQKDFSIERNIDFTTKLSLDFLHSSTEKLNTNRRFYLSDRIREMVESGQLVSNQYLVRQRYYESFLNSWSQTIYMIGLTDDDFFRYHNGYTFYIKKATSTEIEVLDEDSYIVVEDEVNGKFFFQTDYNLDFLNYYYVQQDDELYLKSPSDEFESISYKEYYSNTFTRYYRSDTQNFSTAVVNTYHDLLDNYKIRFTGKLLALVSPLDMISYRFKTTKLGSITNLELDLVQGTSEVTLIDHAKGSIENPLDPIVPDLSARIEIVVELFEPSAIWSFLNFNPWYYLSVRYWIRNLTPVDAQLKAIQLDNDPNNIFDIPANPTGLVIESDITEAEGAYRFDFPNPLENYSGYYEVSVKQGDVESNKKIIYVPSPVIDSRSVILEKLRVERLDYSDRSVFRMFYTITLSGFDPQPSIGIQKVGMTTVIVIQDPNEVSTQITLGEDEYIAEFEGVAGFYVKVVVDDVESNFIHSYF
jgi:hypothetical protein